MTHEPEGEMDARKLVHEVVQTTNDSNPDLEGSVLTGWVLISEWSDPEGQRWLSRLSGSGMGESSPPPWQQQGYLWNALNGWPGE